MDERESIRQAYIAILRGLQYRPGTAGNAAGTAVSPRLAPADKGRLDREASEYADRFIDEMDAGTFDIGADDWPTQPALAYVIEAARCLGASDEATAAALLRMATAEVEDLQRRLD